MPDGTIPCPICGCAVPVVQQTGCPKCGADPLRPGGEVVVHSVHCNYVAGGRQTVRNGCLHLTNRRLFWIGNRNDATRGADTDTGWMPLCLPLGDVDELSDCQLDGHPALRVASRSRGLVGTLLVGGHDRIRALVAREIEQSGEL